MDEPVENPDNNPDEDLDMLVGDDDKDDDDDEDDGDEDAVHHEEIGGLCVRIENMEHAHGVLEQVMTKVGEVEDQVLEMQDKVQTLESIVQELRKENQKLRDMLSTRDGDQGVLASYVLGLGKRLAMMELQIPGPPLGPQ
ncbi:hypothetical protein Tco_1243447 [Tanacetum coccineum]